MQERYRFDFNSSTTTVLTNQNPAVTWKWDVAASAWRRRKTIQAPIDLSDASGNIFLQVDTATTDLGNNTVTNNDINVKGAAIYGTSTNTFGGKFDTASTSNYFTSVQAVGDNSIKSVALTNAPPSIRLSWDKNTTAIGFVSVYVTFNNGYSK